MIFPAILSKISLKAVTIGAAVIIVLLFIYDYQRTKMQNMDLRQKVGVYEEKIIKTEKTVKKLQELEKKQNKEIKEDESRIRTRTYFDAH